jgi:flagellar protein FliS
MVNPAQAYVGQMVATASPARLLVMLYERLQLDLRRSVEAQESGDHATATAHLVHAQDIVLELNASLRTDAWAGAPTLAALYDWLHRELVRANVERNAAVTRDCLAAVEPLAEAWHEAALAAAVG